MQGLREEGKRMLIRRLKREIAIFSIKIPGKHGRRIK
jgi:hypothetical protein